MEKEFKNDVICMKRNFPFIEKMKLVIGQPQTHRKIRECCVEKLFENFCQTL